MHGTMDYMARNAQSRSKVSEWFKPAKSVVLLAFNYGDSQRPLDLGDASTGRIARYALSNDYHDILKAKLKQLIAEIQQAQPGAKAKVFVDTSPILERLYARYAGIGWVAKNTLIVSPKIGSFFFLAGFAIDQELIYDKPAADHCGTCRRCLDACPTDAFPMPRVLDASKCIAYFTIEHRGPIPEGFREGVGDWVFGCDICQEVCPWNRFSTVNASFSPKLPAELPLERLAHLSEEEFERDYADTPLERARSSGLRRNALLAMGNSADASHRRTLEEATADGDPTISEQARWSLAKLGARCLASIFLLAIGFPPNVRSAGTQGDPTDKQVDPPVSSAPTVPGEMQQKLNQSEEERPWYIRALMSPINDGMFVHLPIIDTDPNRGTTYGVMPIWVLKGDDDRIHFIHAPSIDYNRTFRVTGTYRLYYYHTKDSVLNVELSKSQVSDHNLFVKYEDFSFLDRDLFLSLRVQHSADGSNRFFGIGPETPKSAESNYKLSSANYKAIFGAPIVTDSNWKWILSNEMAGDRIQDGPIANLPSIPSEFAPVHRHQDNLFQANLNYDTRDSPVTTSKGAFLNLSAQTSQKDLGSEYVYQRYGVDSRYFYPWPDHERFVTAGDLLFDQIVGNAPFWLMPQLGGKYIFRAYGEGRYIDNGLLVANVEERITLHEERLEGVTTELQFAPFVGLGTVYDTPGDMARKDVRPVVGAAVRAVARPQVVGSIDFGVGQEGLNAFMDINYSF